LTPLRGDGQSTPENPREKPVKMTGAPPNKKKVLSTAGGGGGNVSNKNAAQDKIGKREKKAARVAEKLRNGAKRIPGRGSA